MRNFPDVAAVADPFTGVDIYASSEGGWVTFGGTSVSRAYLAGYMAVVNQQRKDAGIANVGFANPLLYADFQFEMAAIQAPFVPQFDDVFDGTNGSIPSGNIGFTAGFGYDDCTGLGSLAGGILMEDLVAVPPGVVSNSGIPDPPTNLHVLGTTPHSVNLAWTPAKGATGYIVTELVLDTYASYSNFFSPTSVVKSTIHNGGAISKLSPNTTYAFGVSSVNKHGGINSSSLIEVTTAK